MKISRKLSITATIITIIVGCGTIIRWFGVLKEHLKMLDSIQWLFFVIFLTYLVTLLVNFLAYREANDRSNAINARLDAFNEKIRCAGEQSRTAIDNVSNELTKIQQRLPNANTTSN
jgi:Flp pilus assembly protein TadB